MHIITKLHHLTTITKKLQLNDKDNEHENDIKIITALREHISADMTLPVYSSHNYISHSLLPNPNLSH